MYLLPEKEFALLAVFFNKLKCPKVPNVHNERVFLAVDNWHLVLVLAVAEVSVGKNKN